MSTVDQAQSFLESPVSYFGHSGPAMLRMPVEELEALQLAALRLRFAEMRESIQMLGAMAAAQDLRRIEALDDVVPVMFPHTIYKSYPVSLLEKNRYGQLTKWFGKLTNIDLSAVPVANCDGIDSWIDTIAAHSDLEIIHSSGTTGTVSFLPRSRPDQVKLHQGLRAIAFEALDPKGEHDHSNEYFDIIWPYFRSGRSALYRSAPYQTHYFAGSSDRFHAMNDLDMSADVMWLAGRLRNAAARGELHTIELTPQMQARRAQFEGMQAMQQGMGVFLERTIQQLRGKRIWMQGTQAGHYAMAKAGLDRGQRGVFAPDSVIISGGGAKGTVLPDDWEAAVCEFAGIPRVLQAYSMSEMLAVNLVCEHGRIHLKPWLVPFVLNPDSGAPLPRTGQQTGRFAFVDLMATSMWGGFVTGDEVSIDWTPCACGRTTAHISTKIERYSEIKGGDDKISCAAQAEAHEQALDFLTASAS